MSLFTATTRREYRPAEQMREFIGRLRPAANRRGPIEDAEFYAFFREAFERARTMWMTGGSKMLRAVGEDCGIEAQAVRDWTRGKELPEQKRRRAILRRLHSYLSQRYS